MDYDFAVARLRPGGGFDKSFSGDGRRTFGFPNMSASFGNALDIQPDGRIVVAGVSQNATGDHFAVARLKLGGGLDESFSGDGRRTFGFGGINDDGYAVAIQSDGRAIVSGYSEQNRQGDDFAVARLRGD